MLDRDRAASDFMKIEVMDSSSDSNPVFASRFVFPLLIIGDTSLHIDHKASEATWPTTTSRSVMLLSIPHGPYDMDETDAGPATIRLCPPRP